MEGLLPPIFPQASFEAMGAEMGGMFKAFKDPIRGHKMVIAENVFLKRVIPGFVNLTLTPEELAAYKAPFADPLARTAARQCVGGSVRGRNCRQQRS